MTMHREILALFNPGQVVATPAVMAKVPGDYAMACFEQHLQGSWGLLDENDWQANNAALKNGSRILSAYALPDDPGVFWIITEADRSVTTFLLPEDY